MQENVKEISFQNRFQINYIKYGVIKQKVINEQYIIYIYL
ncbi:unnamed protein product [Paramecium primaurelia]|uniref:Uncharacterized protein n=1 Tax=Paramecium primaurelia TaxID=5886 RepID=A0A8S1QKD3_PARPR|nr:unnamed protein product [Paramecium primaurelia]